MKKKTILLSTIIFVALLLTSTTAMAKYKTEVTGSAYGTFEKYKGEPDSASIVQGIWNLKIQDGTVWYYACVMEKNLDEEIEGSPYGSVDILEYTITGKPMEIYQGYDPMFETDVVRVFATYQVKKQWAQMDGTYTTKTWTTWGQITILDNGDVYDVNVPWDDTWWKEGTVLYEDFF